jgi:threonine dehydratase
MLRDNRGHMARQQVARESGNSGSNSDYYRQRPAQNRTHDDPLMLETPNVPPRTPTIKRACAQPAGRDMFCAPPKRQPMTDPVRPVTLDEIRSARARIAGTILRTPLVRLEQGKNAPDIRLKLENLQPINAYKLRGAANAVASLPEAERRRGVWTISAGNAGQGVAYAAMKAGVPCTVVAIESAPLAKLERMQALGARIVPVSYARAWEALEDRAFPGVEGTFIHPFDDHNFIAGNATMGLEILEDAPDTQAVIGSIGGGGLVVGVASAVKALKPGISVFGAEPETAAPAFLSFAAGSPQAFPAWKPSFVDGAGGQSMFPRMWQRMQGLVDGSIVVGLDDVRRAMRLLAEKTRVIAEGAGALALAAALSGKAGGGPVVVVISGGNIDLAKFCELVATQNAN